MERTRFKSQRHDIKDCHLDTSLSQQLHNDAAGQRWWVGDGLPTDHRQPAGQDGQPHPGTAGAFACSTAADDDVDLPAA